MVRGSKVSVIGSDYCSSQMVELVVPKPDGIVLVRNTNNDVIFTIEDTSSFYGWGRKKRDLLDSAGNTILTLRQKIKSLPFRWRVYKGSSKNKNDLIFSAKHSKIFGSDIELNVFLASNKSEKTCDFKVGSSSGVMYTRDSHTNIIAEMRDDKVKVYPGVDQAFIISLIAIQDGINQQRSTLSKAALESILLLIAILFGINQQRSGAGADRGMDTRIMLSVLHMFKIYMWLKNRNNDDASQHGIGAHDHHAMPIEEKGDGAPHGMGAHHHALPIRERGADDHHGHGMGDDHHSRHHRTTHHMHHLMTYAPLIISGLSLLMK